MRARLPLIAGAVVVAAAGTLLLRAPAIRLPPPAQSAHVHDAAGVLGAVGGQLEQMAEAWDAELGIDVHVVTLRAGEQPLLPLVERSIAEHDVGGGSPVGGLLCLLDAQGRRARIAVSPSLAAAFPQPLLARLGVQQLAPYAASGAAGLALLDLLRHLKDYALARALSGALALPEPIASSPATRRALERLASGSGVDATLDSSALIADLRAPVPQSRRALYVPSADPLESAERFLAVLRDLAGDPTLPLFTEGSQLQRARYPVAPFEYWRQRKLALEARPWRVIERGDRAVVTSRKRVRGFVPILLWRKRGLWRVDLVETWKNLFIENHGNYVVANRSTPYLFGLRGLRKRASHDLAPLDLGGRPLAAVIGDLEAELAVRDDPALHFRLAELLFRNCFAAIDAIAHYEQAARGSPRTPEYVRTLAERAMYLGLYDYAIPLYVALGAAGHEPLGDAYFALGDYREAERYYRRALRSQPRSKRLEERVKSARRMRMYPT